MAASLDDPEWANAAVGRADVVLVATGPDSAPDATDIATLMERAPFARFELAIRHDDGRVSGTPALMARYGISRVHHIRSTRTDDAERLARVLLGNEVVLVLGGGGARGLAHIGVLRTIRDRGVPIDAVGGSSSGSLIAASVASEWTADETADAMRAAVTTARGAVDVTVPAVALASGQRITKSLRDAFGDTPIEDLPIPFHCVSTNLSLAESVVHSSGSLWRAVRASIAVPGVFPPVPHGDDLLVDGGVLDNLPVAAMRARHAGATVIAVDVGRRHEIRAGQLPDGGIVSGWSVLGQRMNPFADSPDVSGIARILARLTELGAKGDADAGDITIRPDVEDFGLFDFKRIDDLIERGAAAADAALDQSDLRFS